MCTCASCWLQHLFWTRGTAHADPALQTSVPGRVALPPCHPFPSRVVVGEVEDQEKGPGLVHKHSRGSNCMNRRCSQPQSTTQLQLAVLMHMTAASSTCPCRWLQLLFWTRGTAIAFSCNAKPCPRASGPATHHRVPSPVTTKAPCPGASAPCGALLHRRTRPRQ